MKLDELKGAIIDFVLGTTNAFKTAIASEFYYVENPLDADKVIYPYGVYQFVSGNVDRDTATKFDEIIMQVTFYDDDSSSAIVTDLGNKFDALFDECEDDLDLDSYTVLGVDQASEPREMKTLNGNWQWSKDYKIQLQRN